MSQDFLDVLARHASSNDPERLDAAAKELRALSRQMACVLVAMKDASAWPEVLSQFNASVLGEAKLIASLAEGQLTTAPLLDWARQTLDKQEFLDGVREIEETGGLKFEDFVGELEQAAGEHD